LDGYAIKEEGMCIIVVAPLIYRFGADEEMMQRTLSGTPGSNVDTNPTSRTARTSQIFCTAVFEFKKKIW
jgi:hypothetical protein